MNTAPQSHDMKFTWATGTILPWEIDGACVGESPTIHFVCQERAAAAPASLTQLSLTWSPISDLVAHSSYIDPQTLVNQLPRIVNILPTNLFHIHGQTSKSNVFVVELFPRGGLYSDMCLRVCVCPTATSVPPEISCVNFLVQSRTHRRVSSSQAARRTVSVVLYVGVLSIKPRESMCHGNPLKKGD